MDVFSLIFSVIALCFGVFNLLASIGIIRIAKQVNFKQYFRDTQDSLLNKTQNQPESKKSVYRGT